MVANTQPAQSGTAAQLVHVNFIDKLMEMQQGMKVPIFSGTSKKTTALIELKNDEGAAITRQAREGIAEITKQLTDCTQSNFPEVCSAVENFNLDKLQLAQRVTHQWAVALSHSEMQAEELRPLVAPLREEAERIVAEVKQQLTEIGNGIESQIGYGSNPTAAERQLDQIARRQNLRSRAAVAKAELAAEEHTAATADIGAKKLGLQKATEMLRKLAIDAINR